MTHPRSAVPDPDHIVVIGASYRDGSTDARQAAAAALPELDERVLLETCHRIELIGITSAQVDVTPPLRVTRGRAAVVRTLRTVAGLDSAILGEQQLLGQVRSAYASALAGATSGPLLNELLRRALRVGRRARSMTGPASDSSLAERALASIATPGRALVVGSGTMATRLAVDLAARGADLTVAAGSVERAASVAGPLGARAVPWDLGLTAGVWDVIAFATRIADPLLTDARSIHGTVIDLCAPAAVGRAARRQLGDRLVDLDSLGAAAQRPSGPAVRRIEALVEAEADAYLAWLAERGAADEVGGLHARAAELRTRHLHRLRSGNRFDAAQLAAVERMTAQLVGELLHEPTLRLRAGAGR